MTNPRLWSAASKTLLLAGLLTAPAIAGAAALPVKIEGFEGEVVQVNGTTHSGVMPGKALQQGTQVKTGGDGRADLSLNGAPTLRLGNGVDLLLHSMDQDVLRLRSASGAMYVDTRTPAAPGGRSRDVRLNAGDLRLRIANAEAWIEVDDRAGQVCLVAGVVEVQQPTTGAVRLDTPGQCLRQSGQSSQWTMVPTDLLQARVAATGVQRAVAAVPAAAETSIPKPVLQIKVLPLPGTMPESDAPKSQIVVLQQTPATSALDMKIPAPVDVPEVPAAPEPMPVAPAAASKVAMKLAAPVEVPEVPPAPEPLPVAPAAAQTVAMKSMEPVDVLEVPAVPEPLPVAPAAASTVAMKLAAPVEVPEVPPAPEPLPVAPAAAQMVAMKSMEPVDVPEVPAAPEPASVAPPLPSRPKPVPLAPEPEQSAPAAEVVAARLAAAEAVEMVKPAPPAPAAAPAATETALAAPTKAVAPTGDDGRRWRVVLGSMPEKEKAEMEADRLNARGWAVEAREYRVGERRGFRIGFGEFVARQDAQKALEDFLVQYPDAPAWLAKY